MKTLYLECNMGAAGDMLMAALLELHPDPEDFLRRFQALGIPGVRVERTPSVKCGITGTHLSVTVGTAQEESADLPVGQVSPREGRIRLRPLDSHGHGHHHGGLAQIESLLGALPISSKARADALAVYTLIAQAESRAHGRTVEQIHFHEVGTMDAVADIVGVCLLMEALGPLHVTASPVHVGSGQVRCSHGILPVPTPATAHLLQGVPTYGGAVRGELCTPTGAALLRHFATSFGDRPLMTTESIGYGMGQKDFPVANCVRAFLGTETASGGDEIVELCCNLDDMTGEDLAFTLETLMEQGALDAFFIPIQMKKGRPAQLLSCLCAPGDEARMTALILKHTTTFGVRSRPWRRQVLPREIEEAQTPWGPVRVKTGQGHGATRSKAEYEDLARLARAHDLSLAQVRKALDNGG